MGNSILIIGIVGAVLLLAFIYRKKLNFSDNYRELYSLCRGDRNLAERLILGEINRKPGINRKTAIATAIARITNDRKR